MLIITTYILHFSSDWLFIMLSANEGVPYLSGKYFNRKATQCQKKTINPFSLNIGYAFFIICCNCFEIWLNKFEKLNFVNISRLAVIRILFMLHQIFLFSYTYKLSYSISTYFSIIKVNVYLPLSIKIAIQIRKFLIHEQM